MHCPVCQTGIRDTDTGTSEVLGRRCQSRSPHDLWDQRGAWQEVSEQEPTRPPRTALKDSRVNFMLGTGGLQAKVDYRADPAPKIPPSAPTTAPSLPPLLTQHALPWDEEAKAECLRLLRQCLFPGPRYSKASHH